MEAIGQLASGIAHEINTPTQYIGDNVLFIQETAGHVLTLLGQYAQLLDAAKEGNNPQALMKEIEEKIEEVDLEFLLEELPGAIERTLEGNQRVAEVVRAMKEFAHPDAEGMSPFDLNRSVVSTIAVARNEWKYVADLKTDLDDSLPLVRCIQGAFNQAILNLIVNAAHAVEESLDGSGKTKGLITVSTHHDGSFVVVKVSDNGTGMSPDVLDRMYNPFFTTKAVGKGTGQGLAIVRSVIMDTQNGTLDCESEVGKGTTFTVRIPLGQTND
jgi:signal transduction histidine kinase